MRRMTARSAAVQHRGETEGQIERLEQVFAIIGEKPRGKTCAAIVGITDEGAEIMEEYKGSPALDARLLAAAQAVAEPGEGRRGAGGGREPTARSQSRRPVDRSEAAARRQGKTTRHREWCRGRSQRRPRRTDQRCFHNPKPAPLRIGRQHRGDERTPWNEQVPANLPHSIVLSGAC